LFLPMRLVIG